MTGDEARELLSADDARDLVSAALRQVAPEADLAGADPDGLLQEEFGLDSIDFIAVVSAVHDLAGVDIPERDFPKMSTFRSFVAYLAKGGRP
jgi:acyl carrier protein